MGSWASGGLAISKQPSKRLVDGTIIWKGLGDLGIEDDDIRGFNEPLCVLTANQRPKVGTLVLGPQIVSRLSTSLLPRYSSRSVSLAVH